MYQAQIHLHQKKPCVLNEIADQFSQPLQLEIEELHDHKVTFIINSGDNTTEYKRILENGDEVHNVEQLDDENIVVTKQSCGAYSAVYENHGILRRQNRISRTDRVYNILFFNRDALKDIVAGLREIGEVTLDSLSELGNTSTQLTPRQREVITAALEAGYFEWPRQIDSEELADELNISRATFLEHLRKAEEKLLRDALQDERTDEQALTKP